MVRKGLFTALVVLMIAALMAGCSTQAPSGYNLAATMAPQANSAEVSEQDKAGTDGNSLPVIDPGNVAASGKKIIYTVNMAIEAEDAAAAINSITEKTAELGGYVADSQYYEDSRHVSSSITVRIAPEKLKALTELVGTLGKVLSQNLASQDVTAEYTDIQSNLKYALTQETQLMELMKKAVTVDEILKMRRELNTVQQEIEQLKGKIRLMDNQVGYSTLTISIQQPPPPAVVVEEKPDQGVQFWGFEAVWQKISRGFSDSLNWTLNAISGILMVLSYVSVPLLLIAAVVLGILLLVKLLSNRKKKVSQAK